MKITNEHPDDWKGLQNIVCKYLVQAGYHAESPKTIPLLRGESEVDVFATSSDELIKQFICECKFWNRPVSKENINSFKTVVYESGSTVGIFISLNGFQKGAKDAAFCSNVLLKDWDGFIQLIYKKWLKNRMLKIAVLHGKINYYANPMKVPNEFFHDSENENRYNEIRNRYSDCVLKFVLIDEDLLKKPYMLIDGKYFNDVNSMLDYFEYQFNKNLEEYQELFSAYPMMQPNIDYISSSCAFSLKDIFLADII